MKVINIRGVEYGHLFKGLRLSVNQWFCYGSHSREAREDYKVMVWRGRQPWTKGLYYMPRGFFGFDMCIFLIE